MKTIAKTLLASSLCVLIALPVHAGHYRDDGRFMDRMERQHERIEVGVESGELTRKEVRKLKKQKRKIRSMAKRFREDDVISKKERRLLKKQLDKRSALIWELKHNDRYRHADRYVYRDTYMDEYRQHRHSRHHHRDENRENDGGVVYWLSDGNERPHYGFLLW